MKHIKEYFNDSYITPINESVLALCIVGLCGAIATHFAVRGTKKVRNNVEAFWKWACGDTKLTTTAAESLNEAENQPKFDKSKVQPAMVDSEDTLKKVIEATKAESKKKQGFYIFDALLKDTPQLSKINKAPYYPNYVIYMDAGSKDDESKRPNFYGIVGFSLKYWTVMSKASKDQKLKEQAKNYSKYINIFAVQTDPQYAKQGLFDVYIEKMKAAVKETKMSGLTIKGDNDKLIEVYKKAGFVPCEDLEGYMKLDLAKKEEETTI